MCGVLTIFHPARRSLDPLRTLPRPLPVAEGVESGFHIELTLVVEQRIQRNMFDVTRDGRITASFQVIAEDLPLPIVR